MERWAVSLALKLLMEYTIIDAQLSTDEQAESEGSKYIDITIEIEGKITDGKIWLCLAPEDQKPVSIMAESTTFYIDLPKIVKTTHSASQQSNLDKFLEELKPSDYQVLGKQINKVLKTTGE